MKSALNGDAFLINSEPPTGSFCNISHTYKLFPFQYMRYNGYIFITIFRVYVISLYILISSLTYSGSDTFFYH